VENEKVNCVDRSFSAVREGVVASGGKKVCGLALFSFKGTGVILTESLFGGHGAIGVRKLERRSLKDAAGRLG